MSRGSYLAAALAAVSCVAGAFGAPAASGVAPGSGTGPGLSPAERSQVALDVYGGLGSWLDIFAGASWSHPASVVADLQDRGVQTLYLQTSNYSRRADIMYRDAVGRFVDAAHAAGLSVVAWYLPSLADPALDARRALAAIRFRSPTGSRFDSFALDIEASVVRSITLRNARLLALAARLRSAVSPDYPLGAIIPSPVGMARHPHYWPAFPYAQLARIFDVFVPMAYFSHYVRSAPAVYDYTRNVVLTIRQQTGDAAVPIHVIGGLADGASAAAVAAFARATSDCGVDGASLYEYPQTTAEQWTELATASLGLGIALPGCGG